MKILKNIFLILGILILSIIIFAIVYIAVQEIFNKPENVQVSFQSPGEIKVNSDFYISVIITNLGNKDEILKDIDIPSSFLDFIDFISSDPEYKDAFLGKVSGDYNLNYKLRIPKKEKKEIQLKFNALKVGKVKGELDVSINTNGNSFSKLLYLNIEK